jgi:hypothetical protein
MGFEREKRLEGDPKERELDDELARQLLDEQVALPGKRTLIEPLAEDHPEAAGAGVAVGRRTLLDRRGQPLSPAPPAPIAAQRVLPSSLRLALGDFRSRGLHEVLAALASMGRRHRLMEATLSAARKTSRPGLPSLTMRPAPPDPAGEAMWRAVERRAATLYRRAVDGGDVETEDPAVDLALARAGGGQPLPADVRRKMELELGVGLDRVRIHTDPVAADAARAVRARAFTVGEDIFFAEGAYAPDTPAGRGLLAHELTHVVQAYRGRTEIGGAGVKVSSPDEALEREADGVAEQIGGSRAAAAAAWQLAPGAPEPGSPQAVLAELGPGSAMESGHAGRLGAAMGDDFGDVRIHTDGAAARKASELGARAFTVGNHIAFAPGEYRPGTPEGDALLAHELAHVQQQRNAVRKKRGDEPTPDGTHEADADSAAAGVLARLYGAAAGLAGAARRLAAFAVDRARATAASGLALQRCPEKVDGKEDAAKEVARQDRSPDAKPAGTGADAGVDAAPPPDAGADASVPPGMRSWVSSSFAATSTTSHGHTSMTRSWRTSSRTCRSSSSTRPSTSNTSTITTIATKRGASSSAEHR